MGGHERDETDLLKTSYIKSTTSRPEKVETSLVVQPETVISRDLPVMSPFPEESKPPEKKKIQKFIIVPQNCTVITTGCLNHIRVLESTVTIYIQSENEVAVGFVFFFLDLHFSYFRIL